MPVPTALPTTVEARTARFRAWAATDDDLAWLRAAPGIVGERSWASRTPYVCDCRCRCHSSAGGQLTATGAAPGSCGLLVNLDTMDCERGCRSAHILASECQLDENRPKVGSHV